MRIKILNTFKNEIQKFHTLYGLWMTTLDSVSSSIELITEEEVYQNTGNAIWVNVRANIFGFNDLLMLDIYEEGLARDEAKAIILWVSKLENPTHADVSDVRSRYMPAFVILQKSDPDFEFKTDYHNIFYIDLRNYHFNCELRMISPLIEEYSSGNADGGSSTLTALSHWHSYSTTYYNSDGQVDKLLTSYNDLSHKNEYLEYPIDPIKYRDTSLEFYNKTDDFVKINDNTFIENSVYRNIMLSYFNKYNNEQVELGMNNNIVKLNGKDIATIMDFSTIVKSSTEGYMLVTDKVTNLRNSNLRAINLREFILYIAQHGQQILYNAPEGGSFDDTDHVLTGRIEFKPSGSNNVRMQMNTFTLGMNDGTNNAWRDHLVFNPLPAGQERVIVDLVNLDKLLKNINNGQPFVRNQNYTGKDNNITGQWEFTNQVTFGSNLIVNDNKLLIQHGSQQVYFDGSNLNTDNKLNVIDLKKLVDLTGNTSAGSGSGTTINCATTTFKGIAGAGGTSADFKLDNAGQPLTSSGLYNLYEIDKYKNMHKEGNVLEDGDRYYLITNGAFDSKPNVNGNIITLSVNSSPNLTINSIIEVRAYKDGSNYNKSHRVKENDYTVSYNTENRDSPTEDAEGDLVSTDSIELDFTGFSLSGLSMIYIIAKQ